MMIDPEVLLAPVHGDTPQGIDLRNPSRKPELFDAQTALRLARQREAGRDPSAAPDWAAVEKLCRIILISHSKDMEAAAGLAEASIRTGGFAGLAAAGDVIAGLVDRFWSTLFPVPADDQTNLSPEDARLQPLRTLVADGGPLLPAIWARPLFMLDDGMEFSHADCTASKTWTAFRPEERAKRLSALTQAQRAERENSSGGRLWTGVLAALSGDPGGFLAAARDDIAAALDAWRRVDASIRGQDGGESFSCQALTDLLADILRGMTEVVPVAAAATVADQAPNDPLAEDMTIQSTPVLVSAPQSVASREDALRRLDEVIAFFRRTEPFSPVAYTLEEAVRRARLPWPEWLTEAVPDKQQRQTILNRLGLRQDAD